VKRFLVLYRSSTPAREMMANATPEQAKAGMDAWTGWMQQAGDAIVEPGAPVGGGTQLADGSASESESHVTGYSIVRAESADDAAGPLSRAPAFHDAG
jgi:hypothetical protein